MPHFKLVNPTIIGNFEDKINAKDSLEAAVQMWSNINKYITHSVPEFFLTLENTDTGELFSFQIDEEVKGKMADYTIKKYNTDLTPEQEQKFKREVHRIENMAERAKNNKSGGKRKRYTKNLDDDDDGNRDDSTTTSSEDVYEKYKLLKGLSQTQPIVYWWYTPAIYKLSNVYVPTFNAPLIPYVEIKLSSSFLG